MAAGKIFVTTRAGEVYVISASPEPELLATNKFEGDQGFGGTPAISDGELFIRSDSRLYCIADAADATP